MKLNPDFRSADEVEIPGNLDNLTGWNPLKLPEQEALDKERAAFAELEKDMPFAFRIQDEPPFDFVATKLWAKWLKYQKEKGRYGDSCDWTLFDEWAIQHKLAWYKQLIGSCVISNTFRAWVIRAMYQITLFSGRYLGRKEWGQNNYSFYAPWSYGMMRQRGGLRSGDGGFCAPMAESLLKDGVLPCNNRKLLDLLRDTGNDDNHDFPEPRSTSFYRKFGNWAYNDTFRDESDYKLGECPSVKSASQLIKLLKQCKPAFVCSMIAIKKKTTHKDGFTIHTRNRASQWAHNMAFHGFFFASDGEMFVRLSNESWGPDIIYNIAYSEVESWFNANLLSCNAIGHIEGLDKVIPVIEN